MYSDMILNRRAEGTQLLLKGPCPDESDIIVWFTMRVPSPNNRSPHMNLIFSLLNNMRKPCHYLLNF